MATKDYSKPRATASRLIAKFGGPCAIRRMVTIGGNPWEPGSGTTEPVDYPVTACAPDYNITTRDASLIQAGDRVGFMSVEGLSVEPLESDQIGMGGSFVDGEYVGGTFYSFIDLKPLDPSTAGQVVMYEFHARR